jgi:hypothetical protein
LATRQYPLGYVLNLKLTNPADTERFGRPVRPERGPLSAWRQEVPGVSVAVTPGGTTYVIADQGAGKLSAPPRAPRPAAPSAPSAPAAPATLVGPFRLVARTQRPGQPDERRIIGATWATRDQAREAARRDAGGAQLNWRAVDGQPGMEVATHLAAGVVTAYVAFPAGPLPLAEEGSA